MKLFDCNSSHALIQSPSPRDKGSFVFPLDKPLKVKQATHYLSFFFFLICNELRLPQQQINACFKSSCERIVNSL